MAKTTPTTALAVSAGKTADVGRFEISPELVVFAQDLLHIDLTGSHDERANMAAEHMNRSQRHMLAAGLLLASIKAECDHGEFTALVAARGFEERAARKAMQYAQFVLSQPEAERMRLLEMPRSKVMEIAGADPEVIEDLLAGQGEDSIDALSVRALRQRIQELEAGTVDLTVQRDTAEAEATALAKKLKRGLPDRDDALPHVVADLRAEIMALGKKATLALDSFNALGVDVILLCGQDAAHDWMDATLRLALSQLLTTRLQIDGLVTKFLKEVPGGDPTPTQPSYLTRQEVLETARLFQTLTQTHTYEAELRTYEREQARPQGKGRPKNKPVVPGGEA